jgi:hypothetical protein
MAFVRYKGPYAYLVINERVREAGRSRVRQKVLFYLGRDPEITDEIIAEVERRHPDVEVDWDALSHELTGAGVPEKEDEDWMVWG